MAMPEAKSQFGRKYIMFLATDQNGTLGLYYSNKEIGRFMRENLTGGQKGKIRDPKRNYLTLFGKPLAVLNVTGRGRTPQRHVIIYCNLTLAAEMEKDPIKSLREHVTRDIQEEKLQMARADPTMSVESPPVLAREEMGLTNICDVWPNYLLVPRTPLRQSVTSTTTGRRNWLPSWTMALISGWRQFRAAKRTAKKWL